MPERASPPGDPQRLIERSLQLPNAVWRLKEAAPATAHCLLLAFRYTATSDEKREGLVRLGLNLSTGAALPGELVGAYLASLAGLESWEVPQSLAGAAGHAPSIALRARTLVERAVRADLEPFLAAMRRGLERDRCRVHAYHDDLRRAALEKLAKLERTSSAPKTGGKAQDAVKRERLRIAAIEREYAGKISDLRHNYALGVEVAWTQALLLEAPVRRHLVIVKRRKTDREIAIDCHMTARLMEPPVCDWGDGFGSERVVCDEHLHLKEAGGRSPCPSCAKAYCWACHGDGCPKCGAPVRGNARTG